MTKPDQPVWPMISYVLFTVSWSVIAFDSRRIFHIMKLMSSSSSCIALAAYLTERYHAPLPDDTSLSQLTDHGILLTMFMNPRGGDMREGSRHQCRLYLTRQCRSNRLFISDRRRHGWTTRQWLWTDEAAKTKHELVATTANTTMVNTTKRV